MTHDVGLGTGELVASNDWRWERKGCRVYSAEFHRGRPLKVAEVSFGGLDEDALNARGQMIAAAPDLMAAGAGLLKAYRVLIDRIADDEFDIAAEHPASWASRMEAAILKATPISDAEQPGMQDRDAGRNDPNTGASNE